MRVTTAGQVPVVTSFPSWVTVGFGSQSSDAVGSGHEGSVGQSTVAFAAQVIEGASMSRTVTERLQVDVLPQSSVAT